MCVYIYIYCIYYLWIDFWSQTTSSTFIYNSDFLATREATFNQLLIASREVSNLEWQIMCLTKEDLSNQLQFWFTIDYFYSR